MCTATRLRDKRVGRRERVRLVSPFLFFDHQRLFYFRFFNDSNKKLPDLNNNSCLVIPRHEESLNCTVGKDWYQSCVSILSWAFPNILWIHDKKLNFCHVFARYKTNIRHPDFQCFNHAIKKSHFLPTSFHLGKFFNFLPMYPFVMTFKNISQLINK